MPARENPLAELRDSLRTLARNADAIIWDPPTTNWQLPRLRLAPVTDGQCPVMIFSDNREIRVRFDERAEWTFHEEDAHAWADLKASLMAVLNGELRLIRRHPLARWRHELAPGSDAIANHVVARTRTTRTYLPY